MSEHSIMANQIAKVISIRRGRGLTADEREIVERAFALWLERLGRQYGSPKDDFLTASQELQARTAGPEKRGGPLFLVPKRRP